MHLSTHECISLGQKIVHEHCLEEHLMEQVVYTFWAKKNTNCFVEIRSDFVFSSIVTTNIQKTLHPTNTGAQHIYIISNIRYIRGTKLLRLRIQFTTRNSGLWI